MEDDAVETKIETKDGRWEYRRRVTERDDSVPSERLRFYRPFVIRNHHRREAAICPSDRNSAIFAIRAMCIVSSFGEVFLVDTFADVEVL